mgnify:CR=1 FL=1
MSKQTPEERAAYKKAYREKNKLEFFYISYKIYGAQRASSRERGHIYPDYTLEELRDWMQQQPQLETLLRNYRESEDSDLVPSIDRKKDELPYTLDNIQLGTWKQNRDKESDKKKVAIIQMTLEGEFIKEWRGAREAGRELGISQANISAVCRGAKYHNSSGGYKWKFSD